MAFDEVAGISFKDKDGVQIMKDYMASGSFARGRDAINAYASMVFVGNINQPVDTLVKTSHLFAPFPETMIDSAFFDRFHAYIPGWEIPKMRPEFFTNQYGLIVDYLAEWLREMRKRNFGDAINKYFKLGRDLNQRDTIAVKHTVSGLLKLLYPNEEYDKEAVRRCLEYALEARRRVKEQLKKIGGMEFFDVHFSYIDQETMEEKFISVPEQGGGSLIPDGPLNPGVMHTVATGRAVHLGLYRLETQVTAGNGTLKTSGLGSNAAAKEAIKVGFDYFKANASRVSASIKAGDHDYHLHVVELHNTGPTTAMTLAAFVALCSGVFGQAAPAADGRPGQHEPGRQHRPGREPGRVAPGRLRRRGQAAPAADGERQGHPDHPRRVVRQVPDRLLRRSDRCGVQGVGGGVNRPCGRRAILADAAAHGSRFGD